MTVEAFEGMVAAVENAKPQERWHVIEAAGRLLGADSMALLKFIDADAYFDAALSLLPKGAAWRRLTDGGCSVYAASPYNAAAQVRHDGHHEDPALSLVAAILRMRLAALQKAQAAAARRA